MEWYLVPNTGMALCTQIAFHMGPHPGRHKEKEVA